MKVERANRHIDEMVAFQAAPRKELYRLRVSNRSVAALREPDCDQLTYFPKKPISKHAGAIIGDTVNNLRESLDLWVNAAARCVGPRKKLHFPFTAERKDLERSKSFGAVKKAFPNAAKFISKEIEPCRDTNLHLWAATSLCNNNKHNDFIPVVGISEVNAKRILVGGQVFEELSAGGNADTPQVLFRAPFESLTIEGDLKIAFEISFPKGAIFEYQPVVPTLLQMSEVVSQSLDALERFITPYCR